jgi:signal transduction histidine kinase
MKTTRKKTTVMKRDEISLLYHLGTSLAMGRDLFTTLLTLQKEILKLIEVDAMYIAIYDSETDIVEYPIFFEAGRPQEHPSRLLTEQPGLTGAVLFSNKTLYLADIMTDEVQETYAPVDDNDFILHTFLGIPLVANEKPIGVLSVQSTTVDAYSTDQIRLMENIAVQAALAIDKARLLEQLQRELQHRQVLIMEMEKQNAESETLRESAAIVVASLEKAETLSLILEQIDRVVPCQSASVQLIHENKLEIVSARGIAFPDQDIQTSFPITEKEPAFQVVTGRLPYILYNDVQVQIPSFNEIAHNNIRAWMAVPLKVRGRVIGIIALDSEQTGRFSERDAKLATTFANQAAIALEHSRLFSELQKENSLKQNLIEELAIKNAELERFTYTVSHDLRSPLVTIQGFLGYLHKSALEGNLPAFQKDYERISRATSRMDKLLKDLLELSRIGRMTNKLQDVPFEILAREALEIVHGRLEQRNITVRIHPDLPIVHGDRPRLVEVLQNLMDNAAKYMDDKPEPVIEIGHTTAKDGQPIFFVRDNGMGISPEYHERIFRLFEKLDPSSEGTGVGLALVKRIVEFHGGRIWVESKAGKGSTFFFTLPEKPPNSQ